ncbi:MAG: hypothetical protein JWN56_1892 [Sphingobacteriales bacterium]|nr:hypothetical protein [Sphingobacteriales bacterium]
MRHHILMIAFLLIISLSSFSLGKKAPAEDKKVKAVQVLIVGLNDNVKSNYYYDEVIEQETGMNVDSVEHQYNLIIANNIIEALPKSSCKFLTGIDNKAFEEYADKIEVKGDGEECISNLSNVPTSAFQQTLHESNANYLLVLNQHYLKRQDKPMLTVFYIVSYTLYDQNKKEIYSGNQFFTSMKLESPEKIRQISRKTTSKIASSIVKTLNL